MALPLDILLYVVWKNDKMSFFIRKNDKILWNGQAATVFLMKSYYNYLLNGGYMRTMWKSMWDTEASKGGFSRGILCAILT